jgi:hypothetical protein
MNLATKKRYRPPLGLTAEERFWRRVNKNGPNGCWLFGDATTWHPKKTARGNRNGSRTHPEKLPRGELQPTSKLTASEVRKIRNLYATGTYSYRRLGKMFDVSDTQIIRIVNLESWRHV